MESDEYWNVGMTASRNESNSYSENSLMSWVGREMYSYKNRYSATVTFRADGLSKFVDEKWGYFPSGVIAWNIAEEGFMEDQKLFDQVKLTDSYGVVGNQAINAYETLGIRSGTSYAYGSYTLYTGYWGENFSTPDLRKKHIKLI